jgi:hypothetical protein
MIPAHCGYWRNTNGEELASPKVLDGNIMRCTVGTFSVGLALLPCLLLVAPEPHVLLFRRAKNYEPPNPAAARSKQADASRRK